DRTGNRGQAVLLAQAKASDVGWGYSVARVEHVDPPFVDCNADGRLSTRADLVGDGKRSRLVADPEDGDVVTPRVHGKKPSAALAEGEPTLVAETASGAESRCRDAAQEAQGAVCSPAVGEHAVPSGGVGHDEDGSGRRGIFFRRDCEDEREC